MERSGNIEPITKRSQAKADRVRDVIHAINAARAEALLHMECDRFTVEEQDDGPPDAA